jgi:predicted permease
VFSIARGREPETFQAWSYADFRLLLPSPSVGIAASADAGGTLAERRDEEAGTPLAFKAVSGGYFDRLGARPAAGRLLADADDRPGSPAAIVLSHAFWRQRFDGDASIVGRALWIGDWPVVVAGVAERGFTGPVTGAPPAFWMALAVYADLARGDRTSQAKRLQDQIDALADDPSSDGAARRQHFEGELARLYGPVDTQVSLFGRLAPGVTRDRAGSELTALARAPRLARGDEAGAKGIEVHLDNIASLGDARDSGSLVSLALSILGLVMLIACVNISNVLGAAAVARRREIGTRLALGAGRGRIVRQLLTEGVVLGAAGGACGVLLAAWIAPLVARLLDMPPQIDVSLNLRILLFAMVATTAATLGAGLVPALFGWRGRLLASMKATPGSGAARLPARRLRRVLVGGQATAAVLLLVCATLFTRALVHITSVDLGFDPDRLISVRVDFGREYDGARRLEFWRQGIARVRQIPGVQGAAVAGYAPMGRATSASDVNAAATSRAGTGALGDSLQRFHRNFTTADYFATIGLPLLRGRAYTEEEVRTSAPVAVISQGLARAAWGDGDPIGSPLARVWGRDDAPGAPRLGFLSKPAGTRVIGVVADTVTTVWRPSTAMIYMPLDASIYGPLIVRAVNPGRAAVPVQEALLSLDPNVSPRVTFVSDGWREELRAPRALAALASLLGLTALGLALVGLFGVAAFAVDVRRHEVSVRMALGATARSVVRLLMVDSLRPVAAGAALGLILAPAGARLLRLVLFGVAPYDPWAMAGAALLLAGTAAIAVLIPARRASRVDPVTVLKVD